MLADYGFEYDSDADQEEEDVDIENQYYNAKGTSYRRFLVASVTAERHQFPGRPSERSDVSVARRGSRERRPQGCHRGVRQCHKDGDGEGGMVSCRSQKLC